MDIEPAGNKKAADPGEDLVPPGTLDFGHGDRLDFSLPLSLCSAGIESLISES